MLSINSNLNTEEFYFELVNALTYMKNKKALKNFNILSYYDMENK
jgi:hypothetical protein